ncbi:glycosyltransferase [Saccharopolyspora indica]|uniref:glycosyltransferase n=1 Tax=Saccharopolyspora indica TaxID=1229659 RepID=UPI0022EAFC2B|nr:glycosyltransferase [Saccharopolyspora indica]MDA3645730.1 glycosyltransferase [Saccharopolyspora indica]
MRYLFTMLPGVSHLYPLVPLAQAMQADGHEVLIASSGPAIPAATQAGLHAVDVAPGQDVEAPGRKLGQQLSERPLSGAELYEAVGGSFAEMGELMLDGLVTAVRDWRADGVLYMPIFGAGLLAARMTGTTSIVHGIGHRNPLLWAMERVVPIAERRGVQDFLRGPDVEINLSPRTLEEFNPDAPVRPMAAHKLDLRHAPYNGGAELPAWALKDADRPRVVVCLGTSALTVGDGALLTEIVRGADELEVELILTTGGAELTALPERLPEHVRVIDWLPMRAILPSCAAVVHHAGSGTMFSAYAAGVPQIAIPHVGNAPVNAEITAKRGTGVALGPDEATPETVTKALRSVLEDPGYRAASAEVAAEMAAMPVASEVVSRLGGLVG